jgi:dolichyl-diphosphooligosaccharide--protein glycosyltransferase
MLSLSFAKGNWIFSEISIMSTSGSTEVTKLLSNSLGLTSLLTFVILTLAWVVGFASRLFAIVRFESIIHEFDPWFVVIK